MGLYDRDYTQDNFGEGGYGYRPRMRIGLPPLTSVVKVLLIANTAIFLAQFFGADRVLTTWFSVWPATLGSTLQIWRYVTFQFLHGNIWHLLFNMLANRFIRRDEKLVRSADRIR